MHFFCPKKSKIGSRKTVTTWELLVVGNCATPPWIVFLMLYRMVYKIPSHWNALILAWSAYVFAPVKAFNCSNSWVIAWYLRFLCIVIKLGQSITDQNFTIQNIQITQLCLGFFTYFDIKWVLSLNTYSWLVNIYYSYG